MVRLWFAAFLILFQIPADIQAASDLLKREYKGFTLWLDCEQHHGAVAFYYKIGRDKGNISHKTGKFDYDRKVPLGCQPQSWRSYRTTTVDPFFGKWDRGHLVPPNHMDQDKATLLDTFSLTNTLPQNAAFNQADGAWHLTEMITECYRDITPLKVWGGVIWGHDAEDDFFIGTHGVETPDYWWKLIYRLDKNEYVAWIFPNRRSTKASDINHFLVSIKELKSRLDFMPDLGGIGGQVVVGDRPKASWPVVQAKGELTCEGKSTSSG